MILTHRVRERGTIFFSFKFFGPFSSKIGYAWLKVIKWMLSKGQGKTMGTYYALLNALAEDARVEEAEDLWKKLFSENMECLPRIFFVKMISIYYSRDMHQQMFEVPISSTFSLSLSCVLTITPPRMISTSNLLYPLTPIAIKGQLRSIYLYKGLTYRLFIFCVSQLVNVLKVFADMEELGIRPEGRIVKMMGDVFQKLGMHDKYDRLTRKYPPPTWEYRYIKGKRVKVKVNGDQPPADLDPED